jgi:hypothetical protein
MRREIFKFVGKQACFRTKIADRLREVLVASSDTGCLSPEVHPGQEHRGRDDRDYDQNLKTPPRYSPAGSAGVPEDARRW